MDLTPQTLRQVEFREKLRGYHPDDVDDFLEEVAVSLEGLLTRLQAAEAAARAVPPPSEGAPVAAVAGTSIAGEIGVTEETIRRTLLLAQKTADAAIADAEESAHQILTSSQEEAQRLLEETKASVTTMTRDAKASAQAAITELEQRRASLERDLGSLQAWASQQRDRLRDVLSDQMRALDVWLSTAPAGGAKPPASRPEGATPGRPPEAGGLGSPGGQGRSAEGVVPPPPARPGGREFPNDRGRDPGPPAGAPRVPVEDSFGTPRPDRPAEGAARPGFARSPGAGPGPRRRPDLGDAAATDDIDEGGASGPGRHAARADAEPAIPLGPPAHDDFAPDPAAAHPDEPEGPDVFDQETTRPVDDDAAPGGQRGGRLFKRN